MGAVEIALIVVGAVILGPLLLISLGIFYWAMWNVACHLYEHSMAIREVRKFRRAVKEMREEREADHAIYKIRK